MRADRLLGALLALLLLCASARAQDHGGVGELTVDDVRVEVLRRYEAMDPAAVDQQLGLPAGTTPEQRAQAMQKAADEQARRARGLWSEVMCACPDENFSRTLSNCPDGCADPQKQQILRDVLAGLGDAEIVDRQVQAYGDERVRSRPDSVTAYLLPFLALLAGAVVAGVALRRIRRRPASARAEGSPPPARATSPEALAVERELREIEG